MLLDATLGLQMLLLRCAENRSYRGGKSLLGRESLWSLCNVYVVCVILLMEFSFFFFFVIIVIFNACRNSMWWLFTHLLKT